MSDLIKWDPFKDLENFLSEDFMMPALFPTIKLSSIPVDIYEKDNKLFIEVGLPGLSKNDIKLIFKDNYLIIRGIKEEKKEEKEENYYRKEIRRGKFERIVRLPYEVNEKEAKAEFNNGILKISFPLAKGEEEREIKID